MARCGTGRASDLITPLNGSPGASFEPTSLSQRLRILPITAANEAKGRKEKKLWHMIQMQVDKMFSL